MALVCHPDIIPRDLKRQNPQVTPNAIQEAILEGQKQFQLLSSAYSVLSNPETRTRYDENPNPDEFQENSAYQGCDFESFFKHFPFGVSVDRSGFQIMLSKINNTLDATLTKARWDCRYRKIEQVINQLKQEIADAVPKDDELTAASCDKDIMPGLKVYQFLLDTQIAIQRAKATKEPETHRGLLLGTPILNILTMLGLAIFRLICFFVLKIHRYATNNPDPVFSEGIYVGLFRPVKTRTLYHLDAMEKEVAFRESLLKASIDGTTENGKTYNGMCFNLPHDEEYVISEYFNYSR